MPDEAQKTTTDGSASESATQTPGAKTATTTASDKAEFVPKERFDGVIAERNRKDEKIATLEKQLADVAEKNKTESQKQLDAAVAAVVEKEWKPKGERLTTLEGVIKAEVDALVARIPTDHQAAVDQALPIEVQLRTARAIVAAIDSTKGKPAISSGASPQGKTEARNFTRDDWESFQALARTNPAEFEKLKPEMYAAAHEGRVAGLRPAVGTS